MPGGYSLAAHGTAPTHTLFAHCARVAHWSVPLATPNSIVIRYPIRASNADACSHVGCTSPFSQRTITLCATPRNSPALRVDKPFFSRQDLRVAANTVTSYRPQHGPLLVRNLNLIPASRFQPNAHTRLLGRSNRLSKRLDLNRCQL